MKFALATRRCRATRVRTSKHCDSYSDPEWTREDRAPGTNWKLETTGDIAPLSVPPISFMPFEFASVFKAFFLKPSVAGKLLAIATYFAFIRDERVRDPADSIDFLRPVVPPDPAILEIRKMMGEDNKCM